MTAKRAATGLGRLLRCLVPLVWVAGSTAHAGAWSAGGGEIIGDSANPWFIQNTPQVHYCVMIDDAHFSLTESVAVTAIDSALRYWSAELSTKDARQVNAFLKVGTQEFLRVDCRAPHELAVQLGVLTADQKSHLPDYRRYVSLAVRTDYDRSSLRGTGFIYVAPDIGADVPTSLNAAPGFWSDGSQPKPLAWVLTHEFGHVFGIPHSGAEDDLNELMSASFPEVVVRNRDALANAMPHFFSATTLWTAAAAGPFTAAQSKFFGIAPSNDRMQFLVPLPPSPAGVGRVVFIGRSDGTSSGEQLGVFTVSGQPRALPFGSKIGHFFVPEEQTVFPKQADPSLFLFDRPAGHEWTGSYLLQGAGEEARRQVFFTISQNGQGRLGGILDGRIVLNLLNAHD